MPLADARGTYELILHVTLTVRTCMVDLKKYVFTNDKSLWSALHFEYRHVGYSKTILVLHS